MRMMSAVMKRGANVALSPAGDSSRSAEAAAAATATAPPKTRSLVEEEEDDAPSTADGMVLDLPEEATEKAAASAEEAKPAEPAAPDRTPLAELLARGTGCVVVLKGHRTVVTDGSRFAINGTGNPAMATAGSGDVLTGVIASLIGQKLSPLDAAVLGVHLHGLAGDLARAEVAGGAAGIVATDLAGYLPRAVAKVTAG
jgi:NAD(P)H-hydrate repair Nnr-like enzyme with NAD(P)H-hydrate dehydratase domain